MRKKLEAYQELKYTAINCGIDTDDISFLIKYITSGFEQRSRLRKHISHKKSRKGAVSIILQLSKINTKALEVLEKNIARFVERRENEARDEYYSFVNGLHTDEFSKILLLEFLEDTKKKLLLIPVYPKVESLSCIALDHAEVASTYGFSERCSKVMGLFKKHPHVFAATQGKFTIHEDLPITRTQIEQSLSKTIH